MSERSEMPILLPAPSPEERAKSGSPENRAQPRFPFTAAVEVYEPRNQISFSCRCSDLSAGGCYVDTISPLPVGAVVRVRVKRDTGAFEAQAVVAYAHAAMGMGLSFKEIKREHQAVLRSWIAELSGEQTSEHAAFMTQGETGTIGANPNMQSALIELINLLVEKKIITEHEGARILPRKSL